jgi:hypothetical protein
LRAGFSSFFGGAGAGLAALSAALASALASFFSALADLASALAADSFSKATFASFLAS